MRLLVSMLLFVLTLAGSPQSALLGASLSLQDAFADLLPVDAHPVPSLDPTPRLIMYVQTFTDTANNPLSLLPLLEYDTKITHIILGSIHLHEEPGRIMLNNEPLDYEIYDEIWQEVRILQNEGVKVMGLLGGAAPGTYARLSGSDEQFEEYYRPLLTLVRKHRLDGLDVDIEEKIPLSSALRLLKRLHNDLGPSFILTMAPLATALETEAGENFSGFSYFALDRLAIVSSSSQNSNNKANTTSLVHWYNAQFYGGYARSTWLYDSVVKAGFSSERVVLGVTTSEAGYPNGFTTLKKLLVVVKELKEKYGERFGGVSAWEYWDAGSSDRDMGMQVGGEPWRWVQRMAKGVFGSEERVVKGRGAKGRSRSECWRQCVRGTS